MKTLLTIFSLCVMSVTLIAQNKSEQKKFTPSSELGINVKTLLDELIFDEELIAGQQLFLPERFDPLLTLKYNYTAGMTFRFGGGFHQDEVRDTFLAPGFAEFISSQSVRSVYANFGFQKEFRIQKKLMAYWGFDFLYRNNQRILENEQNAFDNVFIYDTSSKDTFTRNDFGIGIPMGIQYYFTDKISISTEFNTEFLVIFSKSKSENNQQPSVENEEGDRYRAKIHLPLSLFLNFRF